MQLLHIISAEVTVLHELYVLGIVCMPWYVSAILSHPCSPIKLCQSTALLIVTYRPEGPHRTVIGGILLFTVEKSGLVTSHRAS